MANVFTNMMSNLGRSIGNWLSPYMTSYKPQDMSVFGDDLAERYKILRNYYNGDHHKTLRVTTTKEGKIVDDNITQNFVGLAVDRSVSRLFRGGLKFKLPEGKKGQQEYLDQIWDLNKKEILLYQLGLHGGVYGTPFIKIMPGELIDPYTEEEFPKLTPIDPEIIRIKHNPQDMEQVDEYRIEYRCMEHRDGRDVEVGHREITQRYEETWIIVEYEQMGSAPWQELERIEWDYSFPPILHWKNLPSLRSCYGDCDIDDAISAQDKSNFIVSNMGKVIKFDAHKEIIGTGFSAGQIGDLPTAVGAFHVIPNPEAKVYALENQADLASSVTFSQNLRQSIFDITREVDISSMSDKVGALTNFGLHVLWADGIDKNDTKRQLYGDAIKELNRRLLVLNGWSGEDANPGDNQWGEAMPVNIKEELDADKQALEMGIIDKETISNRYQARYGKTWEDIEKALQEQNEKANQANADIGSLIMRNFQRGQGVPQGRNVQQGQGSQKMMIK